MMHKFDRLPVNGKWSKLITSDLLTAIDDHVNKDLLPEDEEAIFTYYTGTEEWSTGMRSYGDGLCEAITTYFEGKEGNKTVIENAKNILRVIYWKVNDRGVVPVTTASMMDAIVKTYPPLSDAIVEVRSSF
jgi:hypothetical protein